MLTDSVFVLGSIGMTERLAGVLGEVAGDIDKADVGAKAEIYRILLAQRDAGLSIVISSSEAPELLTLCDRIIVMHAGRVAGTLHKHEADEGAIFRLAMGHVQ